MVEIELIEMKVAETKKGAIKKDAMEPKICELVALARVLTTRMDPDGMRNQTSAIP